MKNIIIVIVSLLTFGISNVNAAPATTAHTKDWNVYTQPRTLVIENNLNQPLDVTIATKDGRVLSKTKVDGKQKNIPLKELKEGQYKVNIKAGDNKQQNVKLLVL